MIKSFKGTLRENKGLTALYRFDLIYRGSKGLKRTFFQTASEKLNRKLYWFDTTLNRAWKALEEVDRRYNLWTFIKLRKVQEELYVGPNT